MAIWEESGGSTTYVKRPHGVEGYTPLGFDPSDAGVNISRLADSQESNLEFTVGETLKVRFPDDGSDYDLVYLGTITVDGKKYMVVRDSDDDTRHVIGLHYSKAPVFLPAVTGEKWTVCFFSGTLIATPSGERKVEELVMGDLVFVEDSRTVPVKWIGCQTVSTLFGPAERLMPVRFVAGSLGGGGNPFCRIAI